MGVNQLHRGNMNMMNGEELYDYYKSFANQDALPSYFTEDLRNRNFDWWKEGTHLGFAQDYNVSVSGGSEKIKTYTSVGYYNEDGAVKGYDYKRYNLRFNVDYQATDWLTIKPKVWATRSDVMDQQQDLGAIMYVNFPWDSPYDENGDLIQQYRPTTWINSDATNYLYDLQWNYEKKTSYEFMGNFDFDIKFTDWLTFASVNNYKYNSILFKSYQDPRSKKGEADNGLLQDKTTASYRVYSNQLLRFNKVFDKHSINAILAYEWNTFTQEIKDQTAASFAPGFSVADVATLYTDGKISGYVYRQGETKEVGGKLIATVDGEEYTLTPVDVDNKRYSISYKGETYEGDYDYFMLESQGNPKFYSYKCSKQDGYPHLYSPVISRLGELYLIRAEASAKLGNYTKALADLNTVRTRSLPNAGYKSLDATNAHELIMKERQLELAYEADRGFDVYRVGDTMKRHYPGFHDGVPEYPATSPLAIQYIPQSEINAYPGTLTQNP